MVFNKNKRGRRNKKDWPNMSAADLTRLFANRVARIEVLKIEIKDLQRLIDKKMKE